MQILYVVFTLFKDKLLICNAAAAILILLDLRFAILLAADIVLYAAYEQIKKPIKNQQSYPVFSDIHIRYERGKRPHNDDSCS